jgi:hypothetical protein
MQGSTLTYREHVTKGSLPAFSRTHSTWTRTQIGARTHAHKLFVFLRPDLALIPD